MIEQPFSGTLIRTLTSPQTNETQAISESLSVDDFHRNISSGMYQTQMDQYWTLRNEGTHYEADLLKAALPLFYPTRSLGSDGLLGRLNGLAVCTVFPEKTFLDNVVGHLQKWPFVKMYYHDLVGNLKVIFLLGTPFDSIVNFTERYRQAIRWMNTAYGNDIFLHDGGPTTGLYPSYDRDAFLRPNAELMYRDF